MTGQWRFGSDDFHPFPPIRRKLQHADQPKQVTSLPTHLRVKGVQPLDSSQEVVLLLLRLRGHVCEKDTRTEANSWVHRMPYQRSQNALLLMSVPFTFDNAGRIHGRPSKLNPAKR